MLCLVRLISYVQKILTGSNWAGKNPTTSIIMLCLLFISLKAGFAFEIKGLGNVAPLVNEKCPDLDKAELCENACTKELVDCSVACGGGSQCQSNCNKEMIDCIDCKYILSYFSSSTPI